MSIITKKYELIKMGVHTYYLELMFILLNIFQQQKLMKKVILTETLFLKKKDRSHQKKNLTVNLLELIEKIRENYDANYDASTIQTFISKFKDKEKENEVKELKDKINKLKLQLPNLSVENNDNHNNHNIKLKNTVSL